MGNLLTFIKTKKNVLFCMALTLWVSIAYYAFQDIQYELNDDNAMASYLYGIRGYDYEYHLVYINVIIGKLLAILLRVFPNLPWYTLAQCALIILSFFVLIYLLVCRFGVYKALFPIVGVLYFFSTDFFCTMQFSKTAGIATLAGALLLLKAIHSEKKYRRWEMLLAGILILFGSMYRFHAFAMLLIPLFGVGVSIVWEPLKHRNWKEVCRICLPFVVVFSLCIGAYVYNTWVYQQDPGWKDFIEFNKLRSKLLDYGFPSYEENQELYNSLDIYEEDLHIYRSWDIADPDIFNTEALRQLVEAKQQPSLPSLNDCLHFLGNILVGYWYSNALILAVLLALKTGRMRQRFLSIYLVVAFIAVELYLYSQGRYLRNHVDAPLFCGFCLCLVLYCWGEIRIRPRKITVCILAVLLLLSPFARYVEKTKSGEPHFCYELIRTDLDHLYVYSAQSGLPLIPDTFEIYPLAYRLNLFALGGWATNTPIHLDQLERYAVNNPFRDVVDRPDIYLICPSEKLPERLAYIQTHYVPEAQAYCVKIIEETYPVYRISTKGPLLDTKNAQSGENVVQYTLSASVENNHTSISGHMYIDGINSFATNVYIGVENSLGEEQLFYTTQAPTAGQDPMSGSYGVFSSNLPCLNTSDSIRLYLETNDALYSVEAGRLNQILAN